MTTRRLPAPVLEALLPQRALDNCSGFMDAARLCGPTQKISDPAGDRTAPAGKIALEQAALRARFDDS